MSTHSEGPTIDMLIEKDGDPAHVVSALRTARENYPSDSLERGIADVLLEVMKSYHPRAYVRFRCEISIYQSGES